MAYIELSGKKGKGHRTIVDEETYKLYGHLKWHLSDTGYVLRRTNGITTRLHRLVVNAPEGSVVDHLNGNPLDNRKSNLRITTQLENNKNRKGIKGIAYDKSRNKWIVRHRKKFYGRYETEQEASRAYQKAKSGKEYIPRQRKQYMLPKNVHKQFGKYNVSIQRNGIRLRKNGIATLEEALATLKQLQIDG